jgi:hypothetical protein
MDRDSGRPIEELLKLGKMGLELGYREQAEAYFDAVLVRAPGHPERCRQSQILSRSTDRVACVRAVLASALPAMKPICLKQNPCPRR